MLSSKLYHNLCTVECDELEFSLSNKGIRNLDRKTRKRANYFKRNENKDINSSSNKCRKEYWK